MKKLLFFIFPLCLLIIPLGAFAEGNSIPAIGGIRLEFILFALTLVGVALFHKQTFWVAIIGLLSILVFKFIFDPEFKIIHHLVGENSMLSQLVDKELRQGEWSTIINLLGLLLGFALLAKIFEESGVPDIIPKYLPNGWKGGFVLLVLVFILSSFLDNIAAAMIGGTIALVVFKNKVHIGYIAAIVAASNAGGSGSVVGDTTTTMMWIDGVSPLNVFHAYVAAGVALLIIAWFASRQQDKYNRITSNAKPGAKIDWGKILIVLLILVGAILSNFYNDMPALGVWIAVIIGAFIRKMPWGEISGAIKGTVFLLCLVTAASLMPVNDLPAASWLTAFILGFVSAVFDNIPLTKLCLEQGCYDWGMLAYTVGFGGSMIWFGSSAGVAITNKFDEARNVFKWVTKGWYVIVAYVVGFFVLYFTMGWEPADNKKVKVARDCNCEETVELTKKHIFNENINFTTMGEDVNH